MQDDTSSIRFNPSKNGYYREDSKTKPTGSSGSKDFGKVMSKNEREGKSGADKKQLGIDEEGLEEPIVDLALSEEPIVPHGPVSLFDMSKTQNTKLPKPAVKKNDSARGNAETSRSASESSSLPNVAGEKVKDLGDATDASDLVPINPAHIGEAPPIQKRLAPARPFDLLASSTHENVPIEKEASPPKKRVSSELNREQPDLAYANPLAAAMPVNDIAMNLEIKTERPIAPVKSIQELISQMVKAAQSMEAEGKTDTTITLKYPPLFEGARLVVTSFDSARGELNISFENLTAAAQQIVSTQQNKDSLMLALEQKGYHVHMVTASTIDEQRLFTTNVEDNPREREQNRGGQGRQGRQPGQDEEEA